MKKIFVVWALAAVLGCWTDNGFAFLHHGGTAAVNPNIPTLVAGANAPMGQTPAMPSVSTENPRCLDATWGAGCNVTTQTCIKPTTLAPYQPCQPPQMLITTGGTASGGVGQITYTSYASYVYPVGEAIMVKNATQANWNTPNSHVTAFATLASNGACPASGPSVTLTYNYSGGANSYTIGETVYINGVNAGSIFTNYASFGWTAGNPNGSFTVVAAGGATTAWTITYCTSVLVTGTFLLNADNYSGVITIPYIATESHCGIGSVATACEVTFNNPNTCASACVSAATQFIAGQFDDLIINHHFGEQIPLSEQDSTVEPCAITSHISGTSANPAYKMYAELDGGLYAQALPITDPRGTGASGLSAPPKKVYCAQFPASSVPDGEHEVTWIGCPVVGYCGKLQSTEAVDAASGSSTFFKANNHALQGGTLLGVTASPDTQFPAFDWTQSTLRQINGIGSGINVTSISMATGFVTYNFTASNIVNQFQPHSTVGIFGMLTANACVITGGSTTGAVLTINLTGTCVIPTGSTVNISGVTIVGGNAFAWNGTIVKVSSGGTCSAGACSITVPSLSTASFSSWGYSYRSIAGSGATALTTTYIGVPVTGGSGTGGTVNITTGPTGLVTAVVRNATGTGYLINDVIGVNTTGFAGLSGLTGFSATVTGGAEANLNGQCVISSSSPTSITCPTNDDVSTTRVSGGNISSTGNLLCAPGGNGDDPAPYDPAGGTEVTQFGPDYFQLIPYVSAPLTCSNGAGATGCFGPTCGRLPSQQETLWVQRFEAGIDERKVVTSNTPKLETGSYFVYTNSGSTIKHTNVYVDSWNPSSVKSGCYTSAAPCADLTHAQLALLATSSATGAGGNQALDNLTGTKGSCLVFENAGNVSGAIPLYDGEPVNFVSYDDNVGAKLSQFGLYWIVGTGATETGNANGVAIAATPGGLCINDAAAGIFGGLSSAPGVAWLINDMGFDNILLECDTALSSPLVPCSGTHPETYSWKVTSTETFPASAYARSSYLNIGPDVANGVTSTQVSVLNGTSSWFANATLTAQGGRIHLTASNIDKELALTPAVALGPTLPITTVTSGTVAACPAGPGSGHQCETLTFPAHLNPATQVADGATFQVSTATNPLSQAIIVSGVTSIDSSNWNCGASLAAPCGGTPQTSALVGSTPTTATFINDAATGSGIAYSSLTLTKQGLGTTNGTYTNVPLIDVIGSGTGVTANITVAGGGTHIVTSVTLVNPGSGVLGNDTFTATPANIGGVTGFLTTAFAGKITPADLMVEFAPGTFTNTPCATDGVANDTHGFLTCLGANSVSSGIANWVGNNSTSYPLSINGTTQTGATSTSFDRNANCMYTMNTGVNSVAGALNFQAIIPATGGNNDVGLVYYSTALTQSLYAYNQCDTLYFDNSIFVAIGSMTDAWWDSNTISGPDAYAQRLGIGGIPAALGAFYQTNGIRENTSLAADSVSYGWGIHSQDGIAGAINGSFTDISSFFTRNGQSVMPIALGGALNPDGTQWAAITGSKDSSGNEILCSGAPCVTTASVTFELPTGSIPYFATPSWGAFISCHMPTSSVPFTPSTILIGSLIISYLNNDSSPALITTASGITQTCLVSNNPAVVWSNGDHIDFDFNTFGPPLLPGGLIRGRWQTYNNFIQENINAPFMGSMEGWAYQGGSLFNSALEDMNMGLTQEPVESQFGFHTIAQSEVFGVFNVILRNDFFGSAVTGGIVSYLGPWNDMYFINDSGGTGDPNFPGPGGLDWFQSGFWNATNDSLQPVLGETAVGGMASNWAVWPTGTRGVDSSTGLPNSASAPFYNSLLAAPWYGILGDTGLGTQ